ncbi:hypothetical protein DE146DRAFT_457598 [Phaeosphaeria sp. MPI-PUGE-AT-0046c]|nr:hypothetical protein DE146DRAFT_457598 [Phaeosphaeria sp. MPI-PUGE-AT-0046c]
MQPKAWQFVPVDQNKERKVAQRVVRQAAMKDFRRSERLARTKAHMAMQAERQDVDRDSSQPDFRKAGPRELMLAAQGTIGRMPGKGKNFVDPFCLTALPDRQDAPVLLLHLLRDVGPKLQPSGSGDSYNPFSRLFAYKSFMDDGLLSALLFHAAVHLDIVRNQPRSPTTMYYRGQTLRNLRLRLKSATDAVSDTTIVMVGFIAATGIITGDAAAEKTHTCALKTMISLRGGVQNLGGEGSLAMLLTLSDQLSATILDTDPALEALDVSRNAFAHRVPVEYLQRSINCDSIVHFTAEIRCSLQALASLTSLQTQSLDLSISSKLMMSMIQLAYAIEHRLLRSRPPLYLDASTDPRLLLYESCRLALLICISYIFRNLRASSPALQVLSGRLIRKIRSLTSLDPATLVSGERNMLLWILIVGGIASSNQVEYVAIISEMMWDQQAVSTMPLDAFVWSPLMHNEAYNTLFSSICDRVETRREYQRASI